MIDEVRIYEDLLTTNFELDDLQAVEIILAAAVSHKASWSEMLWLRVIGASGSGKTELLRTLSSEPYAVTMETLTAGAIRRGWVDGKKKTKSPTLLQRLDQKLVITKEFGTLLAQNTDTQKEIFALLRSVYDGEMDSDYGSEQGHLHQKTHFDWISGSTALIDSNRIIEYQLGSRFIDIRWGSPCNVEGALKKARQNDGNLEYVRMALQKKADLILEKASVMPKPKLDYLDKLATITASLRSPVNRDSRTKEIDDIPEKELGTRMAQGLSRIGCGLMMLGIPEENLKPYLTRIVFNSMTRIREMVIKCWIDGVTRQGDIATRLKVSQGSISRVTEEINLLGYDPQWLNILTGQEAQYAEKLS